MVRSKMKLHEPEATTEEELDYPTLLNVVLPPEIRVWGWTPVDATFSARCGLETMGFVWIQLPFRYNPLSRTYKYFIVTDAMEGLNIPLMQECCQKFLGVHNFQNFCKMNLDQTSNHEREILDVRIDPIDDLHLPDHSFFVFTIKFVSTGGINREISVCGCRFQGDSISLASGAIYNGGIVAHRSKSGIS